MILRLFRFHPSNFSFRTLNFDSCLIISFLPCRFRLYMSVAAFIPSGFTETPSPRSPDLWLQASQLHPQVPDSTPPFSFPFVTVVHEASDVGLRLLCPFIFFEDSELTSSISNASTTQRKGCLERQTPVSSLSILPTLATFSLFPFHFDNRIRMSFFCTSTKASFDFFSSNSLSSSKIAS